MIWYAPYGLVRPVVGLEAPTEFRNSGTPSPFFMLNPHIAKDN